jgi:hypothetical protein
MRTGRFTEAKIQANAISYAELTIKNKMGLYSKLDSRQVAIN